ncbi:hypothetical protein P262_00906 [Cronobacter malonaticus]|uniref:Uncharacterized protein n=1 Tax=Cronobacter malonaticus TaxID=413503 RepID=V5TV33_9ENTR|nr:hypothetical protein P262_00906 [Cronobacter malonaticus]
MVKIYHVLLIQKATYYQHKTISLFAIITLRESECLVRKGI